MVKNGINIRKKQIKKMISSTIKIKLFIGSYSMLNTNKWIKMEGEING